MNNKPKIAVIGLKGLPAFGGAASVGESLLNHLKNDFDFTVLSIASHTTRKTGVVNGIKQLVFKSHGNGGVNTFLYYIKCMVYCLFVKRFDIIHLHHAESGFITPFLRLRYKVVVTFHGIYNKQDPKFSALHNRFFRWSEKKNLIWANTVISVSKPDVDYLNRIQKNKVLYIPNGIDIINVPQMDNKKEENYLLFAAGRIYEIKGLDILLKALHKISYSGKLIVAGDLNQVSGYKEQIKKSAEGLNIEFKGLIKDKDKLMALVKGAKFFIFPSLFEAMSMMLLEVVSQRTPIIASDIPANKAVFSEDEMLFFENQNAIDLSEKLNYALSHHEAMQQKAEEAFEKMKIQYTWQKVAEKYKVIYKELIN
jgi:glycosyltransferase involved in cell wall biosynthesis